MGSGVWRTSGCLFQSVHLGSNEPALSLLVKTSHGSLGKLGTVVHACDFRAGEGEAGG